MTTVITDAALTPFHACIEECVRICNSTGWPAKIEDIPLIRKGIRIGAVAAALQNEENQ